MLFILFYYVLSYIKFVYTKKLNKDLNFNEMVIYVKEIEL